MKEKLPRVLLTNICTCGVLCAVAQLLAIFRGELPAFSLARYGLNFVVAYPLACLAGLLIPAEKFGAWVCKRLGLKLGPLYAVGMVFSINLIFTLFFSSVMTWFNAVFLAKQGMYVLLPGIVRNYIPMWLVSSFVSGVIGKPIGRLAERKQNRSASSHMA